MLRVKIDINREGLDWKKNNMQLRSTKGHDLNLDFEPTENLEIINSKTKIRLHPADFPGIKPKLLVSEGDIVKKGQPIFFDKKNPDVMFTTFYSGNVIKIVYGEKRVILSIDIQINNNNDEVAYDYYESGEIKRVDKEKIQEILCASGLWPCIRKRPFSKIAVPGPSPKSIFITTESTAPYAPRLKVILENNDIKYLQAGVDALECLTSAPVHMVIPDNEEYILLNELNGVQIHTFSGPHPAGNVGYHISNIDPIENKNTIIWYISLQDTIAIGRLILTGRINNQKIISVGGSPFVQDNKHLLINRGILFSDIFMNNQIPQEHRIVSGDILSGKFTKKDNAVGFYHESISLVKSKFNREFIGWLNPGFTKYSVSKTFISSFLSKRKKIFSTAMNGSTRTILPIGLIEKMCLLDVLPTMLVKSIISRDIEMMEQLGIYECDPEDFALCSFADASKMDIISIVQEGLNYAEVEG